MNRGVIVVLGAAVRADGTPSQALRRRMQHALALAKESPEALLLFTGGLGIHPPSEAEAMARLAREAGVNEARIVLESHATNTAESARLSARLLRELAAERAGGVDLSDVTLVTDRYHQRRSRFAFKRMGLNVKSSSPRTSPRPSGGRVLREWLGLVWYGVTLR